MYLRHIWQDAEHWNHKRPVRKESVNHKQKQIARVLTALRVLLGMMICLQRVCDRIAADPVASLAAGIASNRSDLEITSNCRRLVNLLLVCKHRVIQRAMLYSQAI